MRRRVGFARAIAHKPEILLFDEPNTGLDPIMTDIIAEVILGIRKQLRATIVTITHHIPSARKIGDRLALGDELERDPTDDDAQPPAQRAAPGVRGGTPEGLTGEIQTLHRNIREAR
jgi:ABC-type proline/glycine betaine transport system ATPase subunit